jgi:hypothetical protein
MARLAMSRRSRLWLLRGCCWLAEPRRWARFTDPRCGSPVRSRRWARWGRCLPEAFRQPSAQVAGRLARLLTACRCGSCRQWSRISLAAVTFTAVLARISAGPNRGNFHTRWLADDRAD